MSDKKKRTPLTAQPAAQEVEPSASPSEPDEDYRAGKPHPPVSYVLERAASGQAGPVAELINRIRQFENYLPEYIRQDYFYPLIGKIEKGQAGDGPRCPKCGSTWVSLHFDQAGMGKGTLECRKHPCKAVSDYFPNAELAAQFFLVSAPASQPSVRTRFQEFDDADHPANKWWEGHGQYMMSGGGRKEFIWACRGWIAHEQFAEGVEVTGDSLTEKSKAAVLSAPKSSTASTISLLELWHLLFPEGTHADFEPQDVPRWLDAYTEEVEEYAKRIALLPIKGKYHVSYEFLHQVWQAVGEVPQGVNAIQQGCYEKCRDAYIAIEGVFNKAEAEALSAPKAPAGQSTVQPRCPHCGCNNKLRWNAPKMFCGDCQRQFLADKPHDFAQFFKAPAPAPLDLDTSALTGLMELRQDGWMVAVHNDYRQNGELRTFWLLAKGERCIKGEGRTDAEAIAEIRQLLARHLGSGEADNAQD